MKDAERATPDDTEANREERGPASVPEIERPQIYVAFCGRCHCFVGATANRDHPEATAAFVAGLILDGHAVISCQTRDDYMRLSDRPWCECGKGHPYHQEGEVEGCPECMTPIWEPRKKNTCKKCGLRWTAEKALTLYKVTEFPAKRPDAEQTAILVPAPT